MPVGLHLGNCYCCGFARPEHKKGLDTESTTRGSGRSGEEGRMNIYPNLDSKPKPLDRKASTTEDSLPDLSTKVDT